MNKSFGIGRTKNNNLMNGGNNYTYLDIRIVNEKAPSSGTG